MAEQRNPWRAVLISATILVALIIWSGCKKQPSEQADTEQARSESLPSEPVDKSTDKFPETDTGLSAEPKMSLSDVIKAARTWGPAFESWVGKPAPDFMLTDITGQQYSLSGYYGRNVMIIFWATWCGPCKMELPHLIELRNTIGQDKLAMLAISKEAPALLKKFADQQKINYTVFSNQAGMSEPYSLVNSIPCSFFIDPEGKIKLATIGLLSLGEIKAILQAK